jgi:hypothetical protein
LQVLARLGENFAEFVVGQEAELADRAAQRLRRRRQVIGHRVDRAHADQDRPVLDVHQPELAHQAIKPLAEMHIAANAAEGTDHGAF